MSASQFEHSGSEQESQNELQRKLAEINTFMDSELASANSFRDDDWSAGIVTEELTTHIRNSKNDFIHIREQRILEGSTEAVQAAEVKNFRTISAHHSYSKKGIWELTFYDDDSIRVYTELPNADSQEITYPNISEAENSDIFVDVVSNISEVVTKSQVETMKTFEKYPLPENITTRTLSKDESDDANSRVGIRNNAGLFHPTYEMTSSGGESWLASQMVTDGLRSYALLYRQNPENKLLTPYVVYTSGSQATWRLLPRIVDYPGKSGKVFYDKGLGSGEEVLNLPISLQQTLWAIRGSKDMNQEDIPLAERGYIEFNLRLITDETYNTALVGLDSKPILIGEFGDHTPNSQLLPNKDSEERALFEFTAPVYGEVAASVVSSQDNSIDYLLFTQKSSGKTWVGMSQPKRTQVLESFILDSYLSAGPAVYAPPMEYGPQEKKRGYEDNSAQLAGNVILKSMRGLK